MQKQQFPFKQFSIFQIKNVCRQTNCSPASQGFLVVGVVVYLGVRDELSLARERLAANGTGKGSLAGVQSHVCEQSALLQELLAAHAARVRHTAVQSAVIDKLEFPLERGAAVLTHERMQTPVEPIKKKKKNNH